MYTTFYIKCYQILKQRPHKKERRQYFIKKVQAIAVSRILYLLLQAGGSHLSVRPEPGTSNAGERRLVPYLVLLREEFTSATGLSTPPGGLLPRHFTLTGTGAPAVSFCCAILSAEYCPPHPSFQKDSLPCAVRTFLSGKTGTIARVATPRCNIDEKTDYTSFLHKFFVSFHALQKRHSGTPAPGKEA